MVLLFVVVLYCERELFLSLDLDRFRFSLLIEVLVKLLTWRSIYFLGLTPK